MIDIDGSPRQRDSLLYSTRYTQMEVKGVFIRASPLNQRGYLSQRLVSLVASILGHFNILHFLHCDPD